MAKEQQLAITVKKYGQKFVSNFFGTFLSNREVFLI